MAINFPNNPNLNDTHTVGSSVWRWNGYAWVRVPDPGDKGEKGEKGEKGDKGKNFLLTYSTFNEVFLLLCGRKSMTPVYCIAEKIGV